MSMLSPLVTKSKHSATHGYRQPVYKNKEYSFFTTFEMRHKSGKTAVVSTRKACPRRQLVVLPHSCPVRQYPLDGDSDELARARKVLRVEQIFPTFCEGPCDTTEMPTRKTKNKQCEKDAWTNGIENNQKETRKLETCAKQDNNSLGTFRA